MPAVGEPGRVPAGGSIEQWRCYDAEQARQGVGRPVQTVSGHLAKLRTANPVRYGEKRVTNSLRENSAEAKKLTRVLKDTYASRW